MFTTIYFILGTGFSLYILFKFMLDLKFSWKNYLGMVIFFPQVLTLVAMCFIIYKIGVPKEDKL